MCRYEREQPRCGCQRRLCVSFGVGRHLGLLPDDPRAGPAELRLDLRKGGVVEVLPGGLLERTEGVSVADALFDVAGEEPVEEARRVGVATPDAVDELQIVGAVVGERPVAVGDRGPRVPQYGQVT